ncbi:hypothetical protein FORC065_3202 [Yersinia enterocolitica]|nr:hypothetical protein FORC065_3202 [Yersinia enterocolitica]
MKKNGGIVRGEINKKTPGAGEDVKDNVHSYYMKIIEIVSSQ